LVDVRSIIEIIELDLLADHLLRAEPAELLCHRVQHLQVVHPTRLGGELRPVLEHTLI
jgi:hypothetical protein